MAQLITTDTRRALIGIGVTGYSVARFLRSTEKEFDVFDTRSNPPGLEKFKKEFPQAHIYLGNIDKGQLSAYREVILSPGLDSQSEWLKAAVGPSTKIMGDIDLFARQANAPIVAITGSNAKSTVTTLLGYMAEVAGKNVGVGGNLGTAALDLLADEKELYVLELSSFQLELVKELKPAAACILNISPDHMDRYPSMMAYHAAKQRVYMGAEKVVFNRDELLTQPLLQENQKAISFGMDKPDLNQYGFAYKDGETLLVRGSETIVSANKLALKGLHNLSNLLAAFALGECVGLPMKAMIQAACEFAGLPHRCEFIAEQGEIVWINDSKATNVGAVRAALSGLGGVTISNGSAEASRQKNIVLIAGGQAKGQSFAELAPLVRKHVKQLILIGEDADQIAQDIAEAAPSVLAVDMHAAVATAAEVASRGDTVLLSPACASFDMFSGYEERGRVFSQAARQHLKASIGDMDVTGRQL